MTREEYRLLRSTQPVLLFCKCPSSAYGQRRSGWKESEAEAKESHRHERKSLKQDGVAERLHFLKGSVHCMKWDDPAAFSAAGNCMFCMCFAHSLWPRMCFSPQPLALSLLWVFWFVLSCSLVLFYSLCTKARGACYPFDIFSAQLMLARLWNRSSCNMGPPQQVSRPASVPSPCTHPEEPVCLQCHGCSFSQPEVICSLPPVTLSHSREEGLDSLSHGKCSGSRLPLAFPRLDTSSAKHLNRVCWAAVYSSLPPPRNMTENVLVALMVVSQRSVNCMKWSRLLWYSLFMANTKNTCWKSWLW